MVDAVQSYVFANGFRNFAGLYTNTSDATGEAGVIKIDPTAGFVAPAVSLGVSTMGQILYPGTSLKVKRIAAQTQGLTLRIQWVATISQDMMVISDEWDSMDWGKYGGLKAPAVAGVTGQISFTTIGAMVGSSYTVEIHCIKGGVSA